MTVKIELIHGGRTLRAHIHEGQSFVEAPAEGVYSIRLTNDSGSRRLAILSVDGINVIDGTDAGYNGPGYVLRAWESITIKGWRRTDEKVATFTFQADGESYAAQTGRGTKNTGVIGVAVFEEKVVPQYIPYWLDHWPHNYPTIPYTTRGPVWGAVDPNHEVISSSLDHSGPPTSSTLGTASDVSPRRGILRGRVRATKSAPSLGTGYGQEAAMHTSTTTFERATDSPSQVVQVKYATRERLIEWGVPVGSPMSEAQAFPAAPKHSAVPAPPGWRASR